jgi:hypothetical protein
MDELVLYNRALSPQEVTTNYLRLVPEPGSEALGIATCAAMLGVCARQRRERRQTDLRSVCK